METTVLRSVPLANPAASQTPSIREKNFPSIALANGSHKKAGFAKCFPIEPERGRLYAFPLVCALRNAAGCGQCDRGKQAIQSASLLPDNPQQSPSYAAHQ